MMPGQESAYRDLREWQRAELHALLVEIALMEYSADLDRWADDGGRGVES